MSDIVLQFGQCGNHLGKDFFTNLYNDSHSKNVGLSKSENFKYVEASTSRWFHEMHAGTLTARSVLIESDAKVMKQMNNIENGKWRYSADNFILDGRGGCGNNWPLGYTECGPKIISDVLDKVRKECEKCESLRSFLTLGSTGGGTGSGVCSYVVEKLNDEYPHKTIINSFVLPYLAGDVATQNYNTLLTLSKCHELSSAVILFSNDYIRKQAEDSQKDVTFKDMNNLISEQLSCFLQPCLNSQYLYDFLLPLVPHPSYKLLTLRSTVCALESSVRFESSMKWENLIRQLRYKLNKSYTELASGSHMRHRPNSLVMTAPIQKSVANIVICRGQQASQNNACINKLFNIENMYPSWVPSCDRLTTFFHDRKFLGYDKYALLISNNGEIHSTLNEIIDSAWSSYTHNAYVHRYKVRALKEEEMIYSFVKSESILKSYLTLYQS